MENDGLAGRADSIEQKVDHLSGSLDARFDQVEAALGDQRLYTEFAYERLDSRVAHLEHKVDAGFHSLDEHFNGVDARLDGIDARFDGIDARFDRIDARFNRLERKIDQVIDLHLPKPSAPPESSQ